MVVWGDILYSFLYEIKLTKATELMLKAKDR